MMTDPGAGERLLHFIAVLIAALRESDDDTVFRSAREVQAIAAPHSDGAHLPVQIPHG